MKIKYNIINKHNVQYCTENMTIKEALETIEKSGYRCIPVLDESGKFFKGNIYKAHIYEYIVKENGNLEKRIDLLIKDKEAFLSNSNSFFEIFFSIRELPYIAIIDENGKFEGILPHSKVMDLLEDSWGVKTGSYALTISVHECQGAIKKIVSVINKRCNVQSMMTLDSDSTFLRRIIVTLPKETAKEMVEIIISDLSEIGFRTIDIEDLSKR